MHFKYLLRFFLSSHRSNEAQMHRLMPWLHRELMCFNNDQHQPISHLVQSIQNLIQTYDMTSFEFQSRIRTLVPNHTEHFIHELINYASSPYDLIGYDRFVTYLPRFEPDAADVVNISSSEDGSDVEFVGPIDVEASDSIVANNTTIQNDSEQSGSRNLVEQPCASTSNSNSSRTNDGTTVPQTQQTNIASGDDSEEEEITNYLRDRPNVSNEEVIRGRTGPSPNANNTPSQNVNNNEKSDDDSNRTIIVAPNEPSTSQSTNNTTVHVPEITPKVEPNSQTKSTEEIIDADNGDSDSDECLFVCAKKPPHLRTPEYVELNSDSDSDVVFVSSEQRKTPDSETAGDVRKSIINAMQICDQNLKQKRSRSATDTVTSQNTSSNNYEAKPSTSEAMLQWIQIQKTDENSRRISPRGNYHTD